MKRKKTFSLGALLCTTFLMASCSFGNTSTPEQSNPAPVPSESKPTPSTPSVTTPSATTPKPSSTTTIPVPTTTPEPEDDRMVIYQLALNSGYTGTYEEWLASIRGAEVELRVDGGYIQWKYTNETTWKNLLDLSTIASTPTETTASVAKYKVTFDSDGGTPVAPQELTLGIAPTAPKEPTKENYVFLGWYINDTEWNFDTDYTGREMTLKAKWIEPNMVATIEDEDLEYLDRDTFDGYDYTIFSYKVSFHINYGEELPTHHNRTGYNLLGWTNGDGKVHTVYDFKGNCSLTPVYEAMEMKITYKDAANDTLISTSSISYDDSFISPNREKYYYYLDGEKQVYIENGDVWKLTSDTTIYVTDVVEDVFHIYAPNEEFQNYFNHYISDEKSAHADVYHLDGKKVKWTISDPSGDYQSELDTALHNNKNQSNPQEKVDMFVVDPTYIQEYTNSPVTKDISTIGVTDFSQAYQYTVDAASDAKGTVKGVSFLCCPGGLVYRRSIAKTVLGTDDPAEVQKAVADWDKFTAVAEACKKKGYFITGSCADTYRAFASNATTPWVSGTTLTIPDTITTWMNQADSFVAAGYTKSDGFWDAGKTSELTKDGKAFCTFGPAWYYNYCLYAAMGNPGDPYAEENQTASYGDWGLCAGPQTYYWGGSWVLAAEGGNDDALVAKTMNACLGADFANSILENEAQFSNNKAANAAYATKGIGNGFLNGQNETAIWVSIADSIKFQNVTIYDEGCNENLPYEYGRYLKGEVSTKDQAIQNFYSYIKEQYPELTIA